MSRVAVIAAVLVVLFVAPAAGQSDLYSEIARRDALIAEQENLLNVYRCRFGIDTQVVPGGCSEGLPIRPPATPSVFLGTPTSQTLRVRDDLVAAQEKLLNTYRCMFNVDIEVVPGGCGGRADAYGYWRLAQTDSDFLSSVIYGLQSDTRHGILAVLTLDCLTASSGEGGQLVRLAVPLGSTPNGTVTFDHINGPILIQYDWVVLPASEYTVLVGGDENRSELIQFLRHHRTGRVSAHLHGESRVQRALFWIDGAAEAIAAVERACT